MFAKSATALWSVNLRNVHLLPAAISVFWLRRIKNRTFCRPLPLKSVQPVLYYKVLSSRHLKICAHFYLVLVLRMSGALTLLSHLSSSRARKGLHFTFHSFDCRKLTVFLPLTYFFSRCVNLKILNLISNIALLDRRARGGAVGWGTAL